jgi:Gpi18-like mannosyltransferase
MDHGLSNIYQNPEVNNHPVLLYILKLFSLLFKSSSEINLNNVNYVKAFYIIFDFLSLGLIVHWLNKLKMNIHLIWLIILNPAFWYNTVIWIQCDTVHTFFIFLALYFAFHQKVYLSACGIALALATKLQAIIFIPFIFIILFQIISSEKTESKGPEYFVKKIAGITLSFISTLLIIMIPFIINGTLKESFTAIISRSVDFYPQLSVGAYNFWHLLFDFPDKITDSLYFGILSYKQWGFAIFAAFSIVLLLLLIKICIQKKIAFSDLDFLPFSFLCLAIICILFFYFNTQMHERYIHSAILFGGLYAIFAKKYRIYALISIAYLINLEAIMQTLGYIHIISYEIYESAFFNPVFVSILILISILIGFHDIYRFNQKLNMHKNSNLPSR